jgi:hypothetical protein
VTPIPRSVLSTGERDARLAVVRDQIELMRRYQRTTAGNDAEWMLKEVIYHVWQKPQIPKPRLSKYSLWFPWSPAAYARLDGWVPGMRPQPPIDGLVLEHLIPRVILAKELLAEDPADLAAFLDEHFCAAVVTRADNAQLNEAGMRIRMPAGWALGQDPWVRYREAGFDPQKFNVPCVARPELAEQKRDLSALGTE